MFGAMRRLVRIDRHAADRVLHAARLQGRTEFVIIAVIVMRMCWMRIGHGDSFQHVRGWLARAQKPGPPPLAARAPSYISRHLRPHEAQARQVNNKKIASSNDGKVKR